MEDTFGQVKVGLDADLILVDANPLEDLTALQQISGVMVRGKWISKSDIDSKLSDIATNAAKN
jgi:imidazolonepropionase-like amidohydrolase